MTKPAVQRFSFVIAGLMIFLLTCRVSFSASETDPIDLGKEKVTGTQTPAGSLPAQNSSFKSIILPESVPSGNDLGDVLQSALGVHVESLGGLGRYSTMSIRGSSGNQVAVCLDGIKLSRGTGAIDLSSLPLSHFSRIEVMRGSYGAQFGDTALGGVVNLVTPAGKQGTWGRISLTSGLYTGKSTTSPTDIIQLSNAFGYGTDQGQFFANLEGLWTNGKFFYKPDADLGLGSNDRLRDNNAVESLGALLKGSWYLSDNWGLYGLLDLFASRKDIPGFISFPTPEASQTDRRALAATGLQGLIPMGSQDLDIDARFSFLGERSNYEDPLGGTTGFPVNTENKDIRFSQHLTARYQFQDTHDITFKEELAQEKFTNNARQTHSRTTALFSLTDTFPLFKETLFLTPQAGVELCGGQRELFGVGLGAELKIFSCLSLKSNVGNGFRRPTFAELYYDQGYYAGNPDLAPETSLGIDVGPVFRFQDIQFEAAYFRTAYKDLIVYILQSGFRYKPFNVGKASAEGFEIRAKAHLCDHCDLEANWTYAEVLDKSSDPAWRNNQVPGKPRNQVMARARFHLAQCHPFVEYHFTGTNPITRANTKLVPERHLFHAGIRYDLNERLSFSLTGKNLTDRRAMDIRGFPLPSRSVFATFTLNW